MNIKKHKGNILPPQIIQRIPKNRMSISRTENNIYDDEFVSLINCLNESIKEYYKVSRHNITEVNTNISFYEEQVQAIQIHIDKITNKIQYEKINELYEKINKMEEIVSQLKMNSNSNEKNLNLFFDDAKILFRKMKMKRNQKLTEINHKNIKHSFSNLQIINDSIDSNMDSSKKIFKKLNIFKQDSDEKSLNSINKVYYQVVALLNKFSEYTHIIGEVNSEASNNFTNL